MPYRAQINDHGIVTQYKDTDTGVVISAKEYERRVTMQQGAYSTPGQQLPQMEAMPAASPYGQVAPAFGGGYQQAAPQMVPAPPAMGGGNYGTMPQQPLAPMSMPVAPAPQMPSSSSLVQPGAQMLNGSQLTPAPGQAAMPAGAPGAAPIAPVPGPDAPPTAGMPVQGKSLRMEGLPGHSNTSSQGYRTHGFLDATSIAILLPTLVLLALIIAAAHKKRLFPWQTIRTFNPPSGLMMPRDYERSFVCPPNLRRHGRLGKRDPKATWHDQDGIVLPFGFLARTHLPITIPLGRLPNKNMFIVAPSGSGKTTLMRAVIKGLMAKPCVIIALEAKANDPSLDEKHESFKHTLLPEARSAGFDTLYFNPLDMESVHWNPLDLDPITFASSIVQDVNSLPPEEQHWAERDHGYISGLATLLKWGGVMVSGEDENGQVSTVEPLPCNPRGLMRLVNNRRNIVESLRRLKSNPNVIPGELNELTQTLSSIIRTDSDWDKNIQGVRGRLRMFKNAGVLRCTEQSNIDIRQAMHRPTVLIFGAPASMGPDAESLASCFVYQLQQALHTRYGTVTALPLFAFFDEYQTLNMDIAGRLSAIVRGANGGLTVILQNIGQIAKDGAASGGNPTAGGASELKTIFSNSAIRVCLHNADESTAKFFSDEIGKHAIIVPGISDHYDANGFGIFPTSWNRIHSQQVVARVDSDSIKRMEKHHALVYLSPAGDPEFGELKPFMCDLRGIEEIARLHLLHNVAARNPQGPGVPGPNGVPALPPGVTGGPASGAMGGKISNPVLAAMMSPKALEQAAQLLSSNGTAAPGAPAAPMPGAESMGAGAIGGMATAAVGAAASAAVGSAINGMPKPPFPGAAQPMPVMAGVAAGAPGMMAQPTVPALGAGGGGGVNPAERNCGKCGKYAGKGRFCIECGAFVGPTAGTAAPAPQGAPVANALGYAGAIPPAPGVPTMPQGRQPVTSLNPDMSKANVPQPQPQQPPAQQPGQQPLPRPQQRGNGIEF